MKSKIQIKNILAASAFTLLFFWPQIPQVSAQNQHEHLAILPFAESFLHVSAVRAWMRDNLGKKDINILVTSPDENLKKLLESLFIDDPRVTPEVVDLIMQRLHIVANGESEKKSSSRTPSAKRTEQVAAKLVQLKTGIAKRTLEINDLQVEIDFLKESLTTEEDKEKKAATEANIKVKQDKLVRAIENLSFLEQNLAGLDNNAVVPKVPVVRTSESADHRKPAKKSFGNNISIGLVLDTVHSVLNELIGYDLDTVLQHFLKLPDQSLPGGKRLNTEQAILTYKAVEQLRNLILKNISEDIFVEVFNHYFNNEFSLENQSTLRISVGDNILGSKKEKSGPGSGAGDSMSSSSVMVPGDAASAEGPVAAASSGEDIATNLRKLQTLQDLAKGHLTFLLSLPRNLLGQASDDEMAAVLQKIDLTQAKFGHLVTGFDITGSIRESHTLTADEIASFDKTRARFFEIARKMKEHNLNLRMHIFEGSDSGAIYNVLAAYLKDIPSCRMLYEHVDGIPTMDSLLEAASTSGPTSALSASASTSPSHGLMSVPPTVEESPVMATTSEDAAAAVEAFPFAPAPHKLQLEIGHINCLTERWRTCLGDAAKAGLIDLSINVNVSSNRYLQNEEVCRGAADKNYYDHLIHVLDWALGTKTKVLFGSDGRGVLPNSSFLEQLNLLGQELVTGDAPVLDFAAALDVVSVAGHSGMGCFASSKTAPALAPQRGLLNLFNHVVVKPVPATVPSDAAAVAFASATATAPAPELFPGMVGPSFLRHRPMPEVTAAQAEHLNVLLRHLLLSPLAPAEGSESESGSDSDGSASAKKKKLKN